MPVRNQEDFSLEAGRWITLCGQHNLGEYCGQEIVGAGEVSQTEVRVCYFLRPQEMLMNVLWNVSLIRPGVVSDKSNSTQMSGIGIIYWTVSGSSL